MINHKNGTPQEATTLAERIESLESELAEVKAERDGYRQMLFRILPEGDPTGWPTEEELVEMASHARPIQDTLREIAANYGVSIDDELK